MFKWLVGSNKSGGTKRQGSNIHCGVCGFTLDNDDNMCPACGGMPVCNKCGSTVRNGVCPKCGRIN